MDSIGDICGPKMPSQAFFKKVASLKMSKFRQKYGQFTVEGRKNVYELIHSSYKIDTILATSEYLEKNVCPEQTEIISAADLHRISQFDTPPGILALANTQYYNLKDFDTSEKITIALDGIGDPGNLGTIIRTADWFGIHQVIMSENSADFYNAKVLAASMGSFVRCKFIYTNLKDFLNDKISYGCFLEGENVRDIKAETPCILVVGSESHGISSEVESMISKKITIPGQGGAESLNASVAAGIVMDNFIRQM